MINFTLLGKKGRVGNMLFQVASTIGLAKRHNTDYGFNASDLTNYFDLDLPAARQSPLINEKHYHYHDWAIEGDASINGWLQSHKYWENQVDIRTLFKFKPHLQEKVKHFETKEAICISVRRGDFVGNANYFQLPVMYYLLALVEHFPDWQERNVIVLSDDIEWCRIHFEAMPRVQFAEGLNAYEQLYLGSQCADFIISNSTFSWWAAYLAGRGKVVRPLKNFDGALAQRNNEADYWPESWVVFDHTDKKFDARDTTFTVPVYYDHEDRKQNIDLCICMLQREFDTNVIVGEQGSDKFKYFENWAKYMKFPQREFHRTKMLNDMALAADTLLLINYDCDTFLPPLQTYLMLDRLRKGADMVYPFDGRSARVPRQAWFKPLEKALDLGIFRDTEFKGKKGKPMPTTSVGHVMGFRKQSFIEGGMENEKFVSFGPEDCERWDRFNCLGYRVYRIRGAVYHMDHFIGVNSSSQNPYFRINNKEYDKVHAMNAQQLRAYVNTWPWVNRYTDSYYGDIVEGAIKSAGEFYNYFTNFKGAAVVDIGCGLGEWWNDNPNYVGVDHKVNQKKFLAKKYIDADLEKTLPVFDQKFDLCLCLEVAEHLTPERADSLVAYLCSLADTVAFSAAIPNQGGNGHINEQWQTYWAEKFQANGFGAQQCYPLEDYDQVEFWYRQNLVIYGRGDNGKAYDFVLPAYYKQITDNLKSL